MESTQQDSGGVQLGTNEGEAKVFRAHSVPQGLCENLFSAVKLLANQLKDGDSPILKHYRGLERQMEGTYYDLSEKLHCIGQLQCSGGGPPAWRPAAV